MQALQESSEPFLFESSRTSVSLLHAAHIHGKLFFGYILTCPKSSTWELKLVLLFQEVVQIGLQQMAHGNP